MKESRDKLLFTPGPLTTSLSVKEAMLRDVGSRDVEFIATVREIRNRLLTLAGVSQSNGYEAILMQGSGTFGIEAVISTALPANGKVLVIANGAYGERIVQIASRMKIAVRVVRSPETSLPDLGEIRSALAEGPVISHVAVVHCETSTGLLNPVAEIGQVAREHGCSYIVDAMSSFGAVALDVAAAGIDYLISSANKCIEGVPGFSFIIARRAALLAGAGQARSFSLDVLAQWQGLEKDGQFRFTPPTHALLAFSQALRELEEEGGIRARAARYSANHEVLMKGMQALGFQPLLPTKNLSYIITAFHYPTDPKFEFEQFYRRLAEKGMVIYPGTLNEVNCFRIGSIGRIFEADIRSLLGAIHRTLGEMGVVVPVK
jgi:2-aminoethylphosphonate-pyruvate transaminase